MFVKQLSIFVQNKTGRLSDIANIISNEKIDIRALSLADTSDFGILRLIVDKPEAAADILKKNGLTVKLNDVIAVEIDDQPGSLATVTNVLASNGVGLEYLYAFVAHSTGKARVIIRTNDKQKAYESLSSNLIHILSAEEVYNV